jgi:hypothetical protein
MKLFDNRSLRRLLLCCAYAVGTFFIVASGSGGGSNPAVASCRLEVGAIAAATDASADIWVGVLSEVSGNEVHSVARLNSDGAEKFRVELGRGPDNIVRTLAIAGDGSNDVYVGGDFSEGLSRLNDDGTPDSGFAVGAGFNGPVTRIVPAADGSGDIYVGGFFSEYDGNPVGGLVRLQDDGSLDANFIISAIQAVAMADPVGPAFPGVVYSGGSVAPRIELWSKTAVRDTDFNPPNSIGPVFSITPLLDASGAVYAGGGFSGGIYRLSQFGNIDGAFLVDSGFDAAVRQIVRAADMTGDIYAIGGFTAYQGNPANGIVRLHDDGSREANFIPGSGFTNTDGSVPFSEIASAALAADGSGDIYVGGDFTLYDGKASNGIARLNNDGSLDPGFAVRVSSDAGTCANDTIP